MIFETILLATDFSLPADNLIHCIREFSNLGTSTIILVHVVDIRSAGLSSTAYHHYDEEKLNREKARVEKLGLTVKTHVPIGFPASEIIKAAEEEKASLIAIASHGEGFIRQMFLGSTVFDVVRMSRVPVFLEKFRTADQETGVPMYEQRLLKILLPVDFSSSTRQSVDFVLDVRDQIEELVLVSVIERSRNEEELTQLRQETDHRLQEIQQELDNGKLRIHRRIGEGVASRNILEVADQEQATLIVLPRRGTGTIRELLLGSTAEAVARRSKQPVLLLPCQE